MVFIVTPKHQQRKSGRVTEDFFEKNIKVWTQVTRSSHNKHAMLPRVQSEGFHAHENAGLGVMCKTLRFPVFQLREAVPKVSPQTHRGLWNLCRAPVGSKLFSQQNRYIICLFQCWHWHRRHKSRSRNWGSGTRRGTVPVCPLLPRTCARGKKVSFT